MVKEEQIQKYNKRNEMFGIKIMLCEENGKCIAHYSREEKENLPSFPDFVDESVCEKDWDLFKKSQELTKEELMAYYFDTNQGAPILFHGTSTFYLEEIKRNGFDKRNIVEEFDAKAMLIELEEACIEKNILCKSYWKNDDLENVLNVNNQKIQKETANKKNLEELNAILYTHIGHIKSNVKDFQYGPLFFTTSLERAIGYARANQSREEAGVRGTLGEFLDIVMQVYCLYKKIIGESYSFKNEKCNDLIKKVYDDKNDCIAEYIQPVIIAVRNIPWEKVTDEKGKGEFLPNIRNQLIEKRKYVEMIQDSARYIGENIEPEKMEIVELKDMIENGKIGETLVQKLYDRFGIRE